MKKSAALFLCVFLSLLCACDPTSPVQETTIPETVPAAVPETTVPVTVAPEPETIPTEPDPLIILTEAEKNMLLKIGMAERGRTGCMECIALVMRTVLNRAESGRFGSSIHQVLFSPEQFTPVMDGSYDAATPNECCYDALEMVVHGWDESQGALFYEWCEGKSWHSQNLHLLFQHCDVRFYD